MISDLLWRVSILAHETEDELDIDTAIETVIESVDRGVSDDEREQLTEVLESGWLEQ